MDDKRDAPTVRLGGETRSLADAPASAVVDVPALAFDGGRERFELHGELGRGGMGRVVDAFDHALARSVAVKQALERDADAVRRFDREVRITAQLEHPGIVPIYEAGRDADGAPFYVMRKIDGRALADEVAGRDLAGRLALVPNVLAACDALAFAHARSIIHRDLKPHNVLLGRFGETLVIDWGLACRLDEADASRAGTPGFMAPEQERGERLDERADVYALGATLHFTIAGDAPSRTALPDATPEDLRAIITHALAENPRDRYPGAAALAADLRRFVTGNLVAARRYSWHERLLRWTARHKAIVTVVAASVVAIAIAFARVVAERDAAEQARERESRRVDELTIEKARRIVETDPTLAVQTIAPLVTRGHWRIAAAIGAQAKARGVAWRLPASARTTALAVADDGAYAIAVGDDGVIRRYSIRERSATVVGRGRAADHVEILDARGFVVFAGTELVIHDGAARTIPLAHPARVTASHPHAVYWVDADHRAWRLPRGGTTPVELARDVSSLAPEPDGTQLAVGGASGVWIAGDAAPVRATEDAVHAVAWERGGRIVAAMHRDGGLRAIDPASRAVTVLAGATLADHLVAAGGDVYGQTLDQLFATPLGVMRHGEARAAGLAVLRDDIVAAGLSNGRISLHRGTRVHGVNGPLPIEHIAGGGSTLVAAARDTLLVWNVDDMIPHRIARPPVGIELPAGPHHLLALAPSPASWIDLRRRTAEPGPTLPGRPDPWIAHAPDAALAVARVGGSALVLRGTTATEIARDVAWAHVIDDARVAYAATDGAVRVIDTRTNARADVLPAGPPLQYIRTAGEFLVAVYPDRRCVRVHLPSGRRSELANAAGPLAGHLTPDGTLWFFRDREIHAWRADGGDRIHATLPAPITSLYATGVGLAADTEDVGYLVAFDGRQPVPTIAFGPHASAANGFVLVPGATGGARLVDTATGVVWTIGQSSPERAAIVKLAPDGTAVYERRRDGIWVLPIDRPADAGATQRMLAELAN